MFIVGKDGVIKSNIYEGRDQEWFDNISGRGNGSFYDDLPFIFGPSPYLPSLLKTRYNMNRGYYDHYHFKVKYFLTWFEKYRPDKEAGWVSTYDKWQYETRGIEPDIIYRELSEIVFQDWYCEKDWNFIEIEKKYDSSRWLYDFIKKNNIDINADVTYCFDW